MSELDDLQRILGYLDAVPDPDDEPTRDDLHRLGDEVYTTRFWTPRFCHAVIRAAEAIGAFEPQDDDPVPGREISLAAISPRLFEAFEQDIGMRLFPRLQTVWPYIDYHGLRDAFVIRYAMGEQESLRMHHDVAQISASMKLNDGFEGGELEFPRQGVSNAGLRVGELITWPSLVTHPHAGNQLRSGVKYGLTIWFELPVI